MRNKQMNLEVMIDLRKALDMEWGLESIMSGRSVEKLHNDFESPYVLDFMSGGGVSTDVGRYRLTVEKVEF